MPLLPSFMRPTKKEKTHKKRQKRQAAPSFITAQQQTVYPSLTAAASGLGIDARLLKRAKRAGAPGFEANSRVRTVEVLNWILKQMLSEPSDSKLGLSEKESLETRRLKLKLECEQFAFAQLQKEFVKTSDVERW